MDKEKGKERRGILSKEGHPKDLNKKISESEERVRNFLEHYEGSNRKPKKKSC